MAEQVRVRRDIWSLEEEQTWHPVTRAYALAVGEMQSRGPGNPTSWIYQAQVHGMPDFGQPDDFRGQCQHFSWFFLPWHRLYLHWFEEIVRAAIEAHPDVDAELKAAWALPYWNYSPGGQRATLPAAFRQQEHPSDPTKANPLFVANRNDYVNDGEPIDDLATDALNALAAPVFSLAAEDGEGSGVASTEHRIGGGAWTAYAGQPVSLADAADGTVEVSFRSTDVDGNLEEARSASLRLDRVAPATTADMTAARPGMKVTLTATDATSGVAATEYRVGDGAWAAYAGPVTLDEHGTHTLAFRSTDQAGIVEEVQTVSVTVDATGPDVVVTGLSDGAVYGHSELPLLGWSAVPTGDPVESVTARLDGVAVPAGELDLSRLSLGEHTLVVTALDDGGNVTTSRVVFTVGTSFADVKRLVMRFAEAGSMTGKLRDELLRRLDRAERHAGKNPALAREALRDVRRGLAKVSNAAHREILVSDVDALIAELE
jgi:hypothetical protein